MVRKAAKPWNGLPDDWGKGHYRDVPICKWARLARERHVADLKRQRTPDFPYYFDEKDADRIIWFFSERLRLTEGKWRGVPFRPADWQEWDLLRPLFGWKRLDGTRRFRKALICIPKKQGKSPIGAGVALFGLNADREYGAEIYSTATKEDQAKIVWRYAAKMSKLDPILREDVKRFAKSMTNEYWESIFKPLGRDSETNDGLNIHMAIVDELHAHKTDEVLDIVEQGIAAREQPLILIITTEGYDDTSPLVAERDYAEKILDGRIKNEEYFAYITTVDDPAKWEDPVEWQKANPNLGISVKLEDFQKDFERARDMGSKAIRFKVKRLNIRATAKETWIPLEKLKRCAGPVNWEAFKGKRCILGLDVGQVHDLAALCQIFMDERDAERPKDELPRVYWRMFYWIPEAGKMERWKVDKVPYPEWVNQGRIIETPGERTRPDYILRKILELGRDFDVAEITADPNKAADLLTRLSDEGFTIHQHGQGCTAMDYPCTKFESLISEGLGRYNDDPVFEWMVPNARVFLNGDEKMKIMKKSSPDRVDGVVAAVMATGRLLLHPEPVAPAYEAGRLLVLGA